MRLPATFYGARSASSSAIQIQITDGKLFIFNDEGEVTDQFVFEDIDCSPSLGSLPYELILPSGDKLVIEAQYPIAELLEQNSSYHLLAFAERNKWIWLIAALLVPLTLYWLVKVVIPAGAKSITPLIPHVALAKVDDQIFTVLDHTSMDESEIEPAKQQAVEAQWRLLVQQMQLEEQEFRLNFRKSDFYGANAFALPGGNIVVTDELIELLGDMPEGLNAVLLHEMGHVVHRHGMQMVAESAGTALLMTYFFGDLEGIAELFSGTALTVIQNQFSQSLESEADDFSIHHLKRLGISPKALGDALSRIGKELGSDSQKFSKLDEYLSSHPQIHERVMKSFEAEKADIE